MLREGERIPLNSPWPGGFSYYALVGRATQMPTVAVWSFTVRNSLPVLPVPLGPKLADVPLDLQNCLQRVMEAGRFAGKIDYTQPPDPPLNESDAHWARALLEQRATA